MSDISTTVPPDMQSSQSLPVKDHFLSYAAIESDCRGSTLDVLVSLSSCMLSSLFPGSAELREREAVAKGMLTDTGGLALGLPAPSE